jgi:hypothetical protein
LQNFFSRSHRSYSPFSTGFGITEIGPGSRKRGADLVKAAAAAGDCEARNRQKRGEEEAGEWRRRTWETQGL